MKLLNRYLLLTLASTLCFFHSIANEENNQAPNYWWFPAPNDSICAIDLMGAKQYLSTKTFLKARPITVAVIDGGFDFSHPYLQDMLWNNTKEKPGNGIDDDKNGFIDDVNGWNFLGNAEGKDINKVGTEPFREYKRLRHIYKDADVTSLYGKEMAEYNLYKKMAQKIHIDTYIQYEQYLKAMLGVFTKCDSLMTLHYGNKPTTAADFYKIEVADTTNLSASINAVATSLMLYPKDKPWKEIMEKNIEDYELAHKRVQSLDNYNDDPHIQIGNNPEDFNNLRYGNNNITMDSYHGTMVSGLITQGAKTCDAQVSIMPIRAIPDGDEYDRDVVAAIKYAVDNGAKVINMSFGKEMSTHQDEVDAMMDYAAKKDVFLVVASGNNSYDIDSVASYPSVRKANGERRTNMIVVGSSKLNGDVASFSNYGRGNVDILAPGEDITSTAPKGHYSSNIGTSLSAPIVTGIVAVMRYYFPDIKVSKIREILLSSVTHRDDVEVAMPSKGLKKASKGTMAETCISGGVIDAAKAMKIASSVSKYGKMK